jgi:hypothetical protein
VKDRRLEEATREYYRYQEDQQQSMLTKVDSSDDIVGKYDALFGKHLHPHNALLSPKIATIIRAPREIEAHNSSDHEDTVNLE